MTDHLRILTIGDPHFQPKYLHVVDEFIDKTLKVVESQKPDLVVILGDILHTHETAKQSCHSRACKFFRDIGEFSHVMVLIGNHDRPDNGHHGRNKHFFSNMHGSKNVTIVDEVASIDIEKKGKKYRLVFVPYVPPGKFNIELEKLKVSLTDREPLVIFAHQEFKGAKMGAIISTDGDEWPENYPLVISGHIHEFQRPQKNIIYVGTPFQTTYSENSKKGIYLFDFKSSETEMVLIKLNMRVKESYNVTIDEFKEFIVPDNVDVRLVVKGTSEEIASITHTETFRTLQKQGVKIVLRPKLNLPTLNKETKLLLDKNYLQILYDQINTDEDIKIVYQELFSRR